MKNKKSILLIACPLVLVFVVSSSLLLTGCGKKEASAADSRKDSAPPKTESQTVAAHSAAEGRKDSAPPKTEPQTVAAQPVVVAVQDSTHDNRRMTAIFVISRDKKLEDKIASMEDYVTSQVSGKGFSIINREVAVSSIKSGELEAKMNDATSMRRLAQSMGADYLLVITLNSFIAEPQRSEDLRTANIFNTLKTTYKIIDGVNGGTLAGGTGTVTKKKVSRPTENSGVIEDLLDEASVEIGERTDKAVIAAPSQKLADVEVAIVCGMTDLVDRPISIPDLRVNDQGIIVIGEQKLEVHSLDVDVAINGMVRGSAPGKFKMPRGSNKLRLHREGFNDREMDVDFSDGQTYKAALQMSEAGYNRWMKTTTFLFTIKAGEKLTDGTVKMMEGFAQTLRQSGYRVDTDVKVEAKGKSLFDGATLKVFGN